VFAGQTVVMSACGFGLIPPGTGRRKIETTEIHGDIPNSIKAGVLWRWREN
jgi:hypothetical protein